MHNIDIEFYFGTQQEINKIEFKIENITNPFIQYVECGDRYKEMKTHTGDQIPISYIVNRYRQK